MINLALASILLPAIGAALILLSPRPWAKRLGQVFAGLATLALLVLAWHFAQSGWVAIEYSVIRFGNVEILGLVIDSVSVLVAVAVVGIGFLISVYSGGYLDAGNREHPDGVKRRYFAFLSLFVAQDQGFYAVVAIGTLAYLWFNRDSEVEGTDLLLPTFALPSILGALLAFNVVIGPAFALAMEREDGTLLRHKALPHGASVRH